MHQCKLRTMLVTTLNFTFCSKTFLTRTPFKPSFFSSQAKKHAEIVHWSRLENWRSSPLNHSRFWGPNGPQTTPVQPSFSDSEETKENALNSSSIDLGSCSSLAEMGAVVLSTADPFAKSKLSYLAYSRWCLEGLPIGVYQAPPKPARPQKPQLVCFLRTFSPSCIGD